MAPTGGGGGGGGVIGDLSQSAVEHGPVDFQSTKKTSAAENVEASIDLRIGLEIFTLIGLHHI